MPHATLLNAFNTFDSLPKVQVQGNPGANPQH
jgi:hypothetical protein